MIYDTIDNGDYSKYILYSLNTWCITICYKNLLHRQVNPTAVKELECINTLHLINLILARIIYSFLKPIYIGA